MRDTELSDEYIRLELLKMASHRVESRVNACIIAGRPCTISINDYFVEVKTFTDYIKFGIIPKQEEEK